MYKVFIFIFSFFLCENQYAQTGKVSFSYANVYYDRVTNNSSQYTVTYNVSNLSNKKVKATIFIPYGYYKYCDNSKSSNFVKLGNKESNVVEVNAYTDIKVDIKFTLPNRISGGECAGVSCNRATMDYKSVEDDQDIPIVIEKPKITWEYPTNNIISPFSTQNLKACIKSKSKITDVSLYIDNQLLKVRDFEIQPVTSNCDYHFEKQIQLNKMNQPITIALTATNEGGTTTTSRTIEVQQTNAKVGKYKALLIAEQDYQDPKINKLYKPISDAADLENVLTDKYGFEIIPIAKNPKKKDIVDALIALRTTTNENDNVLIYYSGHGKMDGDEGFWLPSDVSKNDQSSWLSTRDISGYIKRIPSKHTLVVVDACYGGVLILKNADDEKACEVKGSLTSRNAITSGTKEVVPDESVFMKYMVKKLAENTQGCLPADELCRLLEKPVINNSPIKQIPKYGSIPSTGDEGGSFIFMLKK